MTTLPLPDRSIRDERTHAADPARSAPKALPEDDMPPLWVLLLLPIVLMLVGIWAVCRKVLRGIIG